MAQIISEVSERTVKYVSIEPKFYRDLGFPGADVLENMFQYKRDHNQVFCSIRNMDNVRDLIQPTTFKDWCKTNVGKIFEDWLPSISC